MIYGVIGEYRGRNGWQGAGSEEECGVAAEVRDGLTNYATIYEAQVDFA